MVCQGYRPPDGFRPSELRAVLDPLATEETLGVPEGHPAYGTEAGAGCTACVCGGGDPQFCTCTPSPHQGMLIDRLILHSCSQCLIMSFF